MKIWYTWSACIFLTNVLNILKFFPFNRSSDRRRYVNAAILSFGGPSLLTPFGLAFFRIWLYAFLSYLESAFSHATSMSSLQPALNTWNRFPNLLIELHTVKFLSGVFKSIIFWDFEIYWITSYNHSVSHPNSWVDNQMM